MKTIIIAFAFRYALGRHSSAPGVVTNYIKDNISLFEKWELEQLLTETREEIDRAYLNNEHKHCFTDCDIETWENFESFLQKHLKGKGE